MTICFKLPPNSGHFSITEKFVKTNRCLLFRGFTVYDFRRLSTNDEYSLHHDFFDAVTAQDVKFVEKIIDFVKQKNNLFKQR